MSWLDNNDIIDKIQYNADNETWQAFDDVYPIDMLPNAIPHYPLFIVINTHTKNLPGEHWKAILVKTDKTAEVFDSFALPLNSLTEKWLNQFTSKWKRNRLAYQHPSSALCGAYVLYFILNRLKYSDYKSFLKTFSSDVSNNDRMIDEFYRSLQ